MDSDSNKLIEGITKATVIADFKMQTSCIYAPVVYVNTFKVIFDTLIEVLNIEDRTAARKQIFDSLVKRINTNIDMLCDNTDILENIYKKKSDREFARECMKEGSYQLVEAMILENK